MVLVGVVAACHSDILVAASGCTAAAGKINFAEAAVGMVVSGTVAGTAVEVGVTCHAAQLLRRRQTAENFVGVDVVGTRF